MEVTVKFEAIQFQKGVKVKGVKKCFKASCNGAILSQPFSGYDIPCYAIDLPNSIKLTEVNYGDWILRNKIGIILHMTDAEFKNHTDES